MNKKINLLLALLVLSAAWISCNSKKTDIKIAYVRSGDLIYKYKGMEEATEKYKKQAEDWQANLEGMKKEYEEAVAKYNQQASKLSLVEKTQTEDRLKKMEDNLNKYYQGLQDQAKKTDEEMTQGVLNQINTYVEKYGKDHGYMMIFGTSNTGNILYADSLYDLTDTILAGLNRNYTGGAVTTDSTSAK